MTTPIGLRGLRVLRGLPLIVGVIVAHSAHAATLDALAEQLYRGEISTAEFDARSDLIQHPVDLRDADDWARLAAVRGFDVGCLARLDTVGLDASAVFGPRLRDACGDIADELAEVTA